MIKAESGKRAKSRARSRARENQSDRAPENCRVRDSDKTRARGSCSCSFLAELPGFENSRNVEMTAPLIMLPGFRNSENVEDNGNRWVKNNRKGAYGATWLDDGLLPSCKSVPSPSL